MDIRELRINSSVLYEGERVKIDQISQFGNIGLIDVNHTLVSPKDLSPIPITEELLKELGLIDAISPSEMYVLKINDEKYDIWLVKNKNDWAIATKPKDQSMFANIFGETAYCKVDYLHELETFVYLTTKKELI